MFHILALRNIYTYIVNLPTNTDKICFCHIQGVPGGMCQTSGECSLC